MKVKLLSRVRPSETPWTAAYQAPPSMGFSRQEYWSQVPLPSLTANWLDANSKSYHLLYYISSVQFSCHSIVSHSLRPHESQASLSITNSWSSLKLMSIELVMPSSHLILCHPLFLLLPIPPSLRVFSNESTLRMRWPKY